MFANLRISINNSAGSSANFLAEIPAFESLTIAIFRPNFIDFELNNGSNYSKAAFRLWISDETSDLEGVLVLVPGSNGDGRNDVNNADWQAFAQEANLGIMGCYYKDHSHDIPAIEHYVNVKNGSGEAMLEALESFSKQTNLPVLNTIPLLMFGMSAGGEFNYEFACWKPTRVLAFVVNKGGVYYSALASEAAWNVPGLFITGEKDMPYRTNIIKGIFSINRRFGAKWAYAHDQIHGHAMGQSPSLSRSFFREVLKEKAQLESGIHVGLVGLNAQKELSALEANDTILSSWIINEEFGNSWIKFLSNENVPD